MIIPGVEKKGECKLHFLIFSFFSYFSLGSGVYLFLSRKKETVHNRRLFSFT